MQKEQAPSEKKVQRPPAYSCVGSPPTGNNDGSGGKRTPTDIAREFHEKHVSVTVADMRGQF